MSKTPRPVFDAPDAAKSGPPPGVKADSGSGRPNPTLAMVSPIQGREEEFGRAVNVVLKTMSDTMLYQHYFNDALVKAHLSHIQFAKDHGLVDDMIAKDLKNMSPMLGRIRGKIEETGNKELGTIAMFDRTSCFYQMLDEWDSEPGMRRYKEPFGYVLEITVSSTSPLKRSMRSIPSRVTTVTQNNWAWKLKSPTSIRTATSP